MDDLMGLFGSGPNGSAQPAPGADDLMNGFAGLNMSAAGSSEPPPPSQQLSQGKKTNEDILGLF
jgi:AP-1 complex subunit beta-1